MFYSQKEKGFTLTGHREASYLKNEKEILGAVAVRPENDQRGSEKRSKRIKKGRERSKSG